ncbi:hypothetical protein OB13_20665, partial [Pontibacter sp. HJ8]
VLHTYAIITTQANEVVKPIHDRMPVILSLEAEELWLNDTETQDDLLSLLMPFNEKEMRVYTVSNLVNSPSNNVQEIINSL